MANRNLNKIIKKRYFVLFYFVVFLFSVLLIKLFYVQIIKKDYYDKYIENSTRNIVYGLEAPRGRIYDCNKKIIVDNKIIKLLTYKYISGNEIELANTLANILDVDINNIDIDILKNYLLKTNNKKIKSRITDEEWTKYDNREITNDDLIDIMKDRITLEEINNMSDMDRKSSYIYYLMHNGYSYEKKVIKRELSDIEYAKIAENLSLLPGLNLDITWDRNYLYGNTMKSIIGTISNGLPKENINEYLKKGYRLTDRVGISGLEEEYEEYLKGVPNQYKINKDGSYSLYKEGRRGYDLVLNINMDLEVAVDNILKEEVVNGKKELKYGYYNKSYVVISNPMDGSIKALSGIEAVYRDNTYKTYDYSIGIVVNPVVAGSIVKGASHIVGYNTGALTIGEKRLDKCIKLANTPLKCSWRLDLGYLDDLTALKQSSNSYQYQTAIKVGKGNYVYDSPLTLDLKGFDIYRNTFAEFGLGVETKIDLPIESTGYKGVAKDSGLMLDFAIGQYDNYTTIQLMQYINTIANNGTRLKLNILDKIYYPNDMFDKVIYENKKEVLNKVNTKSEYMDRVKLGFTKVTEINGTGYGYIDSIYKPAGKTGTSESFIDTNNDNMVDTKTQTNTFGAYAPSDNPTMSLVVVSPDMGYYVGKKVVRNYINKKIAQLVSKKYYEILK